MIPSDSQGDGVFILGPNGLGTRIGYVRKIKSGWEYRQEPTDPWTIGPKTRKEAVEMLKAIGAHS